MVDPIPFRELARPDVCLIPADQLNTFSTPCFNLRAAAALFSEPGSAWATRNSPLSFHFASAARFAELRTTSPSYTAHHSPRAVAQLLQQQLALLTITASRWQCSLRGLGQVGRKFWSHAVATAILAERLTAELGEPFRFEAFTVGLLHDWSLLATSADQRPASAASSQERTAWLCSLNHFPAPIVAATRHLHQPTAAGIHARLAAIAFVAEHLAEQTGINSFPLPAPSLNLAIATLETLLHRDLREWLPGFTRDAKSDLLRELHEFTLPAPLHKT